MKIKREITWINTEGKTHEVHFVLEYTGGSFTLSHMDLYPSDEDGPLPYRHIPHAADDYRRCVEFIMGTWLSFHKSTLIPKTEAYTYEKHDCTDTLQKVKVPSTTTPQEDRKWSELMDEAAIEIEHEFKKNNA